MRVIRGLGGVIAAGTVVLALVVVGAAILGVRRGFPGPGVADVAWHVAAAALVLSAQIFADRRRGMASFCGAVVVFAVAGGLLWTQWWN
ncbi:hypothetical protein [Nocardia huaxiensis]|uniref:Uncharacterized protein n=1 Tax=Nocardia huaxiensis TaxID=2755382 RepID=A0A7D6ZLU3_9NOCA|nr:hypothetical protein [Nocardia huaxiensis]QLY32820.1 hypothetical protein H0264_11720 [Nocardia huaxiensis]UFS93435.1 hypothetical protein LPY97_21655 [Nocardia huaxiensis]